MRWCASGLVAIAMSAPVAVAQDMAMHGMVMDGPHITLTPRWDERPGDRARADSVVLIARAAVERYRDVAVAEAEGYRRFAPQVKRQRIYHYTSAAAAIRARRRFDAAAPTALLYQDDGSGGLTLVGVMYTTPPDTPLEELDRRIPLSVTRWHQHTNICLPSPGADPEAMLGPDAAFGPRGSITTESGCQDAGGRWFPRMFGWMVHVNVFARTAAGVWGDDHRGTAHH